MRKVMLRKLVSILLVVFLLSTLFVPFNSMASTFKRKVVYYNGEKAASAVFGGDGAVLDDSVASEGTGSLKVTFDSSGRFGFVYAGGVFDASNYEYLKFDVYSANGEILAKTYRIAYQFSADDSIRVEDNGSYLMNMSNAFTANQWHTVTIPVSDLAAGGVDITAIDRIMMFNDQGVWGNQQGQSFWIDNIRFEAPTVKTIYNCETVPSTALDCKAVRNASKHSEGSGSIKVTTNTSNGTFYIQYNFPTAVNASQYTSLKFDIYVESDVVLRAVYRLFWMLDLNNDHRVDDNGKYLMYRADAVNVGGWATVTIPLSEFSNLGVDLSNLTTFVMANDQGVWGGQEGQAFWIDNVRLSYDCSHTDKITSGAVEASNIIEGYTGETQCDLCSEVLMAGATAPAKADVNGNGEINVADLIRMKKYLANTSTEIGYNTADLDYSETIDTEDLVNLREMLLYPSDTAYAVLGASAEFSDLTLSTNLTTGSKAGRNYGIIANGNELGINFSDEFINNANGRDIILTVEYFSDNDATAEIEYSKSGTTQTVNLYSTTEKCWTGRSVRLTDITYGTGSNYDATIKTDADLKTAVIRAEYAKSEVDGSDDCFIGAKIVDANGTDEETAVAEVSVKYFGASGCGTVNDTFAFKSALDYAKNAGAATVYVPAGEYVITESLTVSAASALRGKSAASGSTESPSKIKSYYGKGSSGLNNKAFLELNTDASIRNLTVWYPEQLEDGSVIPYEWTAHLALSASAENITFVNPYQAIRVGPEGNRTTTVRNIYGTPLKTGVYADHNVDIGRFQNINFKPSYYSAYAPAAADTFKAFMAENATAFISERVDWTYFWDFTFEGYNIGIHARETTSNSTEPGTSGGQIYNADITDCNTGIYIEHTTGNGFYLTNSNISATNGDQPIAIKLSDEFASNFFANGSTLYSTGNNVVKNNGTGALSLMNCDISGNNAQALVDIAGSGEVSCVTTNFSGSDTHMQLSSSVKSANLVNNMTSSTFKLVDNTDGSKVKKIYDSAQTPRAEDTTKAYDVTYVTKPNANNLINIADAPYNVTPTANGAGADISATLQTALNNAQAAGGGIVYVPAGMYRIDNSITVPSGVELRGSSDAMLHDTNNATVFYTNYGAGTTSGALIVLSENSGIYGFTVYYDKQGENNNIVTYPYTVQGRGSDVYAVNVMLVNSYMGIDLSSYKCDRHYLSGIYGTPLYKGIVLGGGSVNGVVRDCHFNPNSWLQGIYEPSKGAMTYAEMLDILWPYLLDNTDAYYVGNVTDEVLFNNFVYGSHNGIILADGADAYLMGNGVDGSYLGIVVNNATTTEPIWIVASQICVSGYANDCFMKVTDSFSGTAVFVQTLAFGDCASAVELAPKGTVEIYQLGIARVWPDTESQITVSKGTTILAGIVFSDSNPTYDIAVEGSLFSKPDSVYLYGNIFKVAKTNNITISSWSTSKVKGGDKP